MAEQMFASGFFCMWKWVVYNANSLPSQRHAESRAGPGEAAIAWCLGNWGRVVKSGKEVLAAGQALVDVRGKWLRR